MGLELFAPEDRDYVKRESEGAGNVYKAQMVRIDGTRLSVEVRGREATFRGEPVRLAVMLDVTEKRTQEAELRRQADLLRQLWTTNAT